MKLLIANRGVIACRIARTAHRMGVPVVAVYSEADVTSLHIDQADESLCIGPAASAASYLSADKIIAAAKRTGATAIHPGYGFLSENASFARACEAAGIAFAGPTPNQIEAFGLKHRARELAIEAGLPLLPGTGLLNSADEAAAAATDIGFPVMLKSTAGGGGIGMRVCDTADDVRREFAVVQRLGATNFKDSGIFLEKFLRRARHVEVQIFGDGCGRVLALGERDCSIQRRNQKVIEETPAPDLKPETRRALLECAERLGKKVSYRSAGTVEFILDADSGEFYFLEVNTRLQVEHGVTEEVLGIDLVEWMLRLADGDSSFLPSLSPVPRGHSIQARIYAEDPSRNFQPCPGKLINVSFPQTCRVETWVAAGTEIPSTYDPLVAKLITHGTDRSDAIAKLRSALDETQIWGVETNRSYVRDVMDDPEFVAGKPYTGLLNSFSFVSHTMEVIDPGAVTTLQDWPGRLDYWAVGVPPSGPMDDLSFRLANRLAGNPVGASALEITMSGPTLKFRSEAVVAITGARATVTLNGDPVQMDCAIHVRAESILKIGRVAGFGCRAYLAVAGGIQAPAYLGSSAVFTLGKFGGHAGRALQAGDVLHLPAAPKMATTPAIAMAPAWSNHWTIRVLYGPHGAPDFFTPEDIREFFAADWKVHYNSNPTGIRLIGPKPKWARKDGGEAGLHPSNIHDNAYAIGTIDYTGDMPIILGPDGPSLGGFVCPATIIRADRWIMGQLRPGDTLRFIPCTMDEAERAVRALDRCIDETRYAESNRPMTSPETAELESPIVQDIRATNHRVAVKYRISGDDYLLVEYGPLVLDLDLRFRVHALMDWVQQRALNGVMEMTPGIRSLQIRYDNRTLPLRELLPILEEAEAELPSLNDLEITSRIVHLPLSWDDPATRLAIEKYMTSVRPDAPWCPSNIEFIRRINGLASEDEVRRIVFDANYLVLGLGDVYLGAPVATPLDPRHRLVTTKYNPARTWTPENAVGIGGAYMCVYGMEGPGGYQFVGRTVQMWNTHRQTRDFKDGKPWLLRFFDQIRFYPVESGELLDMRDKFLLGRWQVKMEETTFRLRDYHKFLHDEAASIANFRTHQRQAFAEERERWAVAGQNVVASESITDAAPVSAAEIPADCEAVHAPLTGNLWKLLVRVGDEIRAGQEVVIIEAMKMEAAIASTATGRVVEIRCAEGRPVNSGESLLIVKTAS
jgi:urea carboxylase